MERVEFTVELEERDLRALNRRGIRVLTWALPIVTALFAVETLVLTLWPGLEPPPGGMIVPLVLLLLGVVLTACIWVMPGFLARRHFPDVARFATTAFIIDEQTIVHESVRGHGTFFWNDFRKIVETDGHWFLYITPATAVIIPKRCVTEPERFRSIVKAGRGSG